MVQLDGTASLAARRSYLKRRRAGRFSDRSLLAVWIAAGAVALWLSVVGFVGIDR